MEFLAKIVKGERSKNKQFWRYTFIDTQTGKEDWFINNYRVSYIPNLVGRLILSWSKDNNYKLYQDFKQDEEFEEEEGIDWWEEELFKGTKKVDENLTKRPIKFRHQDYVEFVEGLNQAGVPWKMIAKLEKKDW